MMQQGSQTVTFRVATSTVEKLDAYCESRGITRSSAMRMILEATFAATQGRSPREAAILAAVDEAVWRLSKGSREVVAEVVTDAAEKLSRRLLEKFAED